MLQTARTPAKQSSRRESGTRRWSQELSLHPDSNSQKIQQLHSGAREELLRKAARMRGDSATFNLDTRRGRPRRSVLIKCERIGDTIKITFPSN